MSRGDDAIWPIWLLDPLDVLHTWFQLTLGDTALAPRQAVEDVS